MSSDVADRAILDAPRLLPDDSSNPNHRTRATSSCDAWLTAHLTQ
jgi:hypothetical protein